MYESRRRVSGVSLLAMNAPGTGIPFLTVIRALNDALYASKTEYAIIGGVAVVRAGGARTTGDVDILVESGGWERFRSRRNDEFGVGADWARHRGSGVSVDVLFSGDDWELPFPLPDPRTSREWDDEVGAWFMRPVHLVGLKAAVYLSKRDEFGEATAAKDLSDVRAILEANPTLAEAPELLNLPDEITALLTRTAAEIKAYYPKRPRSADES